MRISVTQTSPYSCRTVRTTSEAPSKASSLESCTAGNGDQMHKCPGALTIGKVAYSDCGCGAVLSSLMTPSTSVLDRLLALESAKMAPTLTPIPTSPASAAASLSNPEKSPKKMHRQRKLTTTITVATQNTLDLGSFGTVTKSTTGVVLRMHQKSTLPTINEKKLPKKKPSQVSF